VLSGGTISAGAFRAPELSSTLERWARHTRFDATLASASSVAPYLMRPGLRELPAVVDLMDVDSQKWLDYAQANWPPRSWLYRLEGARLRRVEEHLARRARAALLVAQAEARLSRQVCPAGDVHAVTNGVDLDYFAPPVDDSLEEPGRCVFVGAMDYLP